MKARFITFEGIEGSGKSTVAEQAGNRLREAGVEILMTREPGGTETSERIRRLLLDPQAAEIRPKTELLLYVASRAQLVEGVVRPALEKGVTVLCDRFMDASVAYQGWARGLGEETVERLNEYAVGKTVPDRTFLLDLPVEKGFERGPDRRQADGVRVMDRLEREARGFHERVREGYLRLAGREPGRIVAVDASRPLADVVEEVIRNLSILCDVQL